MKNRTEHPTPSLLTPAGVAGMRTAVAAGNSGPEPRVCAYCGQPLEYIRCAYPFWRHTGSDERHGAWVPAHDCPVGGAR